MKKYITLVKREVRLFWANPIMKVLYLGGPVLYAVLFGSVYTKGKLTELPVIVVDKDQSPFSARLIDMLDETEALQIKAVQPGNVDLEKVFLQEAAYAVIVIPDRFEADIWQGRHPELNTYINNVNLLAAGYASRSVTAVAATFNAGRVAAAGKTPEAFHLNTFRLFNRASNYFMFIWPSYLAIILQSVVMVVLALSFASEWDTPGRLQAVYAAAGRSVIRLMAAKLSTYWLLSVFILLVYTLYFTLFHQPYPPDPWPVFLIAALFIAANSFVGMIAGLLFRDQLKALQFLMILSLPVYISSGFSWPFEQDGWPAQFFSLLFPFMGFVNGFRILLMAHGTLADISDYLAIQAIQCALYCLLAWRLLHIRVKNDNC